MRHQRRRCEGVESDDHGVDIAKRPRQLRPRYDEVGTARNSGNAPQLDARVAAAMLAGVSPLAMEQPATAYDSVVAMLQSWMVGGSVLLLIFSAVTVAAFANPLTKRRQQAMEVTKATK